MTEPYEIICDSKDQAAWLAARNKGLGGSEIAAILGVSKRRSALDVYAVKTGITEAEDISDLPFIRLGHALEPVIAEIFTERTGIKLVPHGKLIRSREHPWAQVTPDFLTEDGAIPVESKSTGRGHIKDWENGCPPYYLPQLYLQMLCTQKDRARIAVLTADPYFDVMHDEVVRDDALMREVIEKGSEFWDRVMRQEPPYPDGTKNASDVILKMFPDAKEGITVSLPTDAMEWDRELQGLKLKLKADEKRKRELENRIKAEIGDAEAGTCANGVRYTHKRIPISEATIERKAYTQSRLYRKEA